MAFLVVDLVSAEFRGVFSFYVCFWASVDKGRFNQDIVIFNAEDVSLALVHLRPSDFSLVAISEPVDILRSVSEV